MLSFVIHSENTGGMLLEVGLQEASGFTRPINDGAAEVNNSDPTSHCVNSQIISANKAMWSLSIFIWAIFTCELTCQCTAKLICTHNPLIYICASMKNHLLLPIWGITSKSGWIACNNILYLSLWKKGQDTLSSLLCWCHFLPLINKPLIAVTDQVCCHNLQICT